jgi:peptidoglycan/xylan/chitin deacetylase (PgdA/CDA1 family)
MIPTLDVHVDLLRESIVSAGIPLVEIPPLPASYRFIACLTHDVDFVGIRRHKFDLTMLGFIYRAILGSLSRAIEGSLPWGKLLKNWKAVASLPGIYLGVAKDFMIQFDRYAEIEQGFPSTFFFIPQKNKAGLEPEGRSSRGRAVKYDMADIPNDVQKLLSRGCEIGLHGIDAWHSPERGEEEKKRVSQITGKPDIGVRMHWLFFTEDTPRILEEAGFSYDSTCGYNDAVGYKAGTSQVFQPPGTGLPELPLLIMDTALFSPGRMGLSEGAAFERMRAICSHASEKGGAVTINWHHRSIGPERFWDDFYIRLLEELKKSGAWFTTARGAVAWFEKRRSVVFKNVETHAKGIAVKLSCPSVNIGPGVILRVHYPPSKDDPSSVEGSPGRHKDVPVNGDYEAVVPLIA